MQGFTKLKNELVFSFLSQLKLSFYDYRRKSVCSDRIECFYFWNGKFFLKNNSISCNWKHKAIEINPYNCTYRLSLS